MVKIIRTAVIFCFLFLFACTCRDEKANDAFVTQWVDPFIGVEIGNTLPGPQLPFGMVRLGPDVAPPNHTSGYRPDKPIRGFSHNHVSGTGGGARYGNIMIIPGMGGIDLFPTPKKRNEYARPGYYAVTLYKNESYAQCELTATNRAGMHRYTFSLEADTMGNLLPVDTIHPHILIDPTTIINMVKAEPTECTDAAISIVSDNEISGFGAFSGGWGGKNPYKVYFYAQFDRPFSSSGTWKHTKFDEVIKSRTGSDIGAYTYFTLKQKEQVQIKVGISYISVENARNNSLEISDWDFDRVRMNADSVWNSHLNLINVSGGTPEQKVVFYTALYHTLVMPTDMGTDENPEWKSDKTHYWDYYTIWDTYRTVMPLHTLIMPERQSEIINCLLDIYEHRGWLPDAWTAGDFAMIQGGSNADVAIADAVVKGLKGIDTAKAYEAIKKNTDSISDRPYRYGRFLEEYHKLEYVSSNIKNGSSRTLEYAYNDFCIAQVAKVLGKSDDYLKYLKRSYNSFNIFNPDTRFFWAKNAGGKWMDGFSPVFRLRDYWNGPYFYEGTPWNYSTYFPHDMKYMIEKHGGNSDFASFLDELFDGGHYEMGNEPGFLTPYLYHYAGRPDKSFERVRNLLSYFKVGNSGLPGQDDSGAMSAWYVFGAMGFYPVAGQDVYLIGSPVFSQSVLNLGKGKSFRIIARYTSEKNIYVQSATLNGKKWEKCWFLHSDICEGGELILEMGATPSSWGWEQTAPPPSASDQPSK